MVIFIFSIFAAKETTFVSQRKSFWSRRRRRRRGGGGWFDQF